MSASNADAEEEDDEFFGAQEANVPASDPTQQPNDMAAFEARAVAERFRKIGFHEAYDAAQEECLQEGFEAGFFATFDQAQEIGRLLGKAVMRAELAKNDESMSTSSNTKAAKLESMKLLIREQLAAPDLQTSDLEALKLRLQAEVGE